MAIREQAALLLIDRDARFVYLMERYSTISGYRCLQSETLEQALEQIQREPPAIIFLNLLLPPSDGWHVLRALKAEPATRDIPVAVYSAMLEEEQAWDAGADLCLRQPVLYTDFVGALALVK